MGDDREVRCFAWALEHQKNGAEGAAALVDQVRQTWYAQRDADEGCRTAAERMLAAKQLKPLDIWRKARLSIEAGRTRPTRDAVEMVSPDSLGILASLQANPARFLADRKMAISRSGKELVTLALVKLAASDPQAAAEAMQTHMQLSHKLFTVGWPEPKTRVRTKIPESVTK